MDKRVDAFGQLGQSPHLFPSDDGLPLKSCTTDGASYKVEFQGEKRLKPHWERVSWVGLSDHLGLGSTQTEVSYKSWNVVQNGRSDGLRAEPVCGR
jgi:hypothetical protein